MYALIELPGASLAARCAPGFWSRKCQLPMGRIHHRGHLPTRFTENSPLTDNFPRSGGRELALLLYRALAGAPLGNPAGPGGAYPYAEALRLG
jgi:hypothetical protein